MLPVSQNIFHEGISFACENCLRFIYFSFEMEFFQQHTFLNLMSLENISWILFVIRH